MAVVTSLFLSLLIFKDIVAPIFQMLVYFGAGIFVLGSIFICAVAYEHFKTIRAKRKAEERKAQVITVVGNDGSFYYSDLNKDADWVARHRHPAFRVNGVDHEPTKEEIENWYHYNKPSQKIIEGKFQQLEAGEKSTTFYDLLRDYPHLMLLSQTGGGKSTQMATATDYRVKQFPDAKVLWLSTHTNKDLSIIPSYATSIRKPENVAKILDKLLQEYHKRMAMVNDDYDTIIVAMDEWTEIVDLLKEMGHNPGEFLKWVGRGGRKVRMFLILASHGGTVRDLDIAGFSSIKNEFAEVHLNKILTKQGKALWQQFDKKSSRIEITLPEIVQVELSDREKAIMELYRQGIEPYKIAKQVYKGRPGGEQLNRVKETIIKNA